MEASRANGPISEAESRERVELLRAEAKRSEGRLENIFVIFREMGSQLEELLGSPGSLSGDNGETADVRSKTPSTLIPRDRAPGKRCCRVARRSVYPCEEMSHATTTALATQSP